MASGHMKNKKPQKIVTRHVKIPRSARPYTAKGMRQQAIKQLKQGEKLVRLAFVAVENEHIVLELGVQQTPSV